ncbi:MAG: S8 family serine peptidase [Bacteroidota bacterium]
MKYNFLPIALLAFLSCHAQIFDFDNSDLDAVYRNLYLNTEASLQEYAYSVEREGRTATVTDQFMIFLEGSETADADQLRQDAAAAFPGQFSGYRSCGCDGSFRVEVWQIDGINGNERGKSGKDRVATQIGREEGSVITNAYLFPHRPGGTFYQQAFSALPPNFQVLSSGIAGPPQTIAILDSGIDPRLQSHSVPGQSPLYLWENPDEDLDGADQGDDPFCYVDDLIGWDFINNDNNPMDDHSHGTHVAGIVANTLSTYAPSVNYQLMPLKVLDHKGVGTTFEAICALLYAAENGADVINLSWGFVGDENPLLTRAMEYAIESGATIVTSAGNDNVDLSYIDHWPSAYALPGDNNLDGVLFAAAHTNPDQLWASTNFRTDAPGQGGLIAPPGENITSLIPLQLVGLVSRVKSGTSMAAPALAALAAEYRRLFPDHSPASVRHNINYLVREGIDAGQIIVYGQQYDFQGLTWLDLAALYNQHSGAMWTD